MISIGVLVVCFCNQTTLPAQCLLHGMVRFEFSHFLKDKNTKRLALEVTVFFAIVTKEPVFLLCLSSYLLKSLDHQLNFIFGGFA